MLFMIPRRGSSFRSFFVPLMKCDLANIIILFSLIHSRLLFFSMLIIINGECGGRMLVGPEVNENKYLFGEFRNQRKLVPILRGN